MRIDLIREHTQFRIISEESTYLTKATVFSFMQWHILYQRQLVWGRFRIS